MPLPLQEALQRPPGHCREGSQLQCAPLWVMTPMEHGLHSPPDPSCPAVISCLLPAPTVQGCSETHQTHVCSEGHPVPVPGLSPGLPGRAAVRVHPNGLCCLFFVCVVPS